MANKNPITEHRKGQFILSRRLLDDCKFPALLKVFRNIFIVRCNFLYERGVFEYFAYSDYFDAVNEGDEAPAYSIEVDTTAKDKFIFKRIA